MAGGKIKGISKKEGGDIKKILARSADTKRALPPMGGGSSVAAPFHWHLKRRFQHPLYADVNGNLVLLDGFAALG